MNLRIVGVDFLYSIRSWSRSRGTVFWSLLFPVMLILLFGAIFSGIGDSKYTIYVKDLDNTDMSQSLVTILNKTGILNIKNVSTNQPITDYIKENNIKNLKSRPGSGSPSSSSIAFRIPKTWALFCAAQNSLGFMAW